MRQLVELHDLLDVFDSMNTDIIAIAQREKDPATMARVAELVGSGITVVTDVDGVSTKTFPLFVSMIIDSKGVLRTAIPGTKTARARTDVILAEVADVAGVEAPAIVYEQGRMVRIDASMDESGSESGGVTDVLGLRTAWSHDAFVAGSPTRLIALPEIAAGWHVYAENSAEMTPFSVELALPDGLSLATDDGGTAIDYPTPVTGHDALLETELAWYENDIPIPAFTFETSPDVEPGTELTVRLTVRYQACNAEMCTPPETQSWDVTLPVAEAGTRRGQLYGWQGW
jgi:hypothetical protein